MSTAIRRIGDLSDPAHAALFPKLIRGLSLDATITSASMTVVREYGLDQLGFRVEPGAFSAWQQSLEEAERTHQGVVMPLWQPYHLNALYPLRRLEDPKRILGGVNRVTLAARTGVPETLPQETTDALRQIGLTLDGVSEMDKAICIDGKTPEQAASDWFATRRVRIGSGT